MYSERALYRDVWNPNLSTCRCRSRAAFHIVFFSGGRKTDVCDIYDL